jgi:hypothetical protein
MDIDLGLLEKSLKEDPVDVYKKELQTRQAFSNLSETLTTFTTENLLDKIFPSDNLEFEPNSDIATYEEAIRETNEKLKNTNITKLRK